MLEYVPPYPAAYTRLYLYNSTIGWVTFFSYVEFTFEVTLPPAGLLDTRIWLAQVAATASKLRWVAPLAVRCGAACSWGRQALNVVSAAHRTWKKK